MIPPGKQPFAMCAPTPQLLIHSLAGNDICVRGQMEGLNALLGAFMKMPKLASIK